MAEVAIHTPIPYGSPELKQNYQKFFSRGLIIAALIHLAIVGSYYGAGLLHHDEGPTGPVRILKYSELGPPPSIAENNVAPPVAVEAPVVKPSVGVPVPVPDALVNPEQTIASQEEMSQAPATGLEGVGTGAVPQIQPDIKVDDNDEPKFVAYEQEPVPVKQVKPEYPSIAKQASLEGTVVVQVLVGEDGKVKKAKVAQSDSPIFEQAAIDAAMQWVFTPALQQKKPVAVWIAIPFRFSLKEQ